MKYKTKLYLSRIGVWISGIGVTLTVILELPTELLISGVLFISFAFWNMYIDIYK